MAIAEALASRLVGERLAACVNILPAGQSVYEWQGKVEKESEHVLLIKSRADRLEKIERTLLEHHPYELPELIAVPITEGLSPFLSWIDTELDKKE
jgi:periplasmic divalent cation tolerance protein